MGEQVNQLTEQEARLVEFVQQYISRMSQERRQMAATGDTSIKVVFRRGDLIEVHLDDHLKLTPNSLLG